MDTVDNPLLQDAEDTKKFRITVSWYVGLVFKFAGGTYAAAAGYVFLFEDHTWSNAAILGVMVAILGVLLQFIPAITGSARCPMTESSNKINWLW